MAERLGDSDIKKLNIKGRELLGTPEYASFLND